MASISTMQAKDMRAPEPAPSAGLSTLMREPSPTSASGMANIEEHPEWPLLSRIPMRLTAGIPLPQFRVKDLLALKPGQILTSNWLSTDDVPLKIGSVQLSWSEFEVVDQQMAIRLTRLA
jgi:flagellar motor switch protein FliM